jgi:hypothetical protein
VPLVAIIADPKRFHGTQVSVRGFVSTMEDYSVVSFSREMLAYSIGESCVYLDLSRLEQRQSAELKRYASGRCWRLRGTIDAKRCGPDGMEVPLNACTLVVKDVAVQAEPLK